jgi:hypothetical protein
MCWPWYQYHTGTTCFHSQSLSVITVIIFYYVTLINSLGPRPTIAYRKLLKRIRGISSRCDIQYNALVTVLVTLRSGRVLGCHGKVVSGGFCCVHAWIISNHRSFQSRDSACSSCGVRLNQREMEGVGFRWYAAKALVIASSISKCKAGRF